MNGKLLTIALALWLSCVFIVDAGVIQNNEVIDDDVDDYFGVQIYKIERVCAMVGGVCVNKKDCAEGYLTSTSGLCPNNKHLGVECCYKVSPRPATCRQLLGECMPYCNGLKQSNAIDCPDRTECCILL